jgi:hypothetical protein
MTVSTAHGRRAAAGARARLPAGRRGGALTPP